MSNKSKKLNKPFAAEILKTAKKIANKYEVILTRKSDTEWYGRGLEMPYVFGEGSSLEECVDNTREALIATVACLLEQKETIPAPASSGKRSEQVNIRLTVEEKTILGATARSNGFHGLADFIRAKALAHHL